MILQPLVISLLFICLITTGLVLGAASEFFIEPGAQDRDEGYG